MHICAAIIDMRPGPGAGSKKAAVPAVVGVPFLGPGGPGPGPISTMAEHVLIKGNQWAIYDR